MAANAGVKKNEVYKNLAALAAVGLDVRHYDLLAHVAAVTPGRNPFVQATLSLSSTLAGAARVDPRFAYDPTRVLFLIQTAREQVAAVGQTLPVDVANSLLTRLGINIATTDDETASGDHQYRAIDGTKQAERLRVSVRDE